MFPFKEIEKHFDDARGKPESHEAQAARERAERLKRVGRTATLHAELEAAVRNYRFAIANYNNLDIRIITARDKVDDILRQIDELGKGG